MCQRIYATRSMHRRESLVGIVLRARSSEEYEERRKFKKQNKKRNVQQMEYERKQKKKSKLRRITGVFGRERFPAHVRRTPSTVKKIELQAIRCMGKTTRVVSQSTQKSIYEARECASTPKQLVLFFLFGFSHHCICKRFFLLLYFSQSLCADLR